jgi:hypothetical protein
VKVSHLLLGVAGAGLFCAGVVLARTSTPSSQPEVAPRAAVVTTPSGRTSVAPPAIPRATSALAGDLHDADPHVRAAAVADVARDGGDVQVMLAASRDPSPDVALRAMAELGKLYAQGAIPAAELVSRARDRALDEKVRGMALNGLGVVPSTDALNVLGDLALHGGDAERRTAAILLANQDPNAAVPVLIAALGDADEYVRSNASSSLQHLAHGRDYGADANAWRSWWQSRIVKP